MAKLRTLLRKQINNGQKVENTGGWKHRNLSCLESRKKRKCITALVTWSPSKSARRLSRLPLLERKPPSLAPVTALALRSSLKHHHYRSNDTHKYFNLSHFRKFLELNVKLNWELFKKRIEFWIYRKIKIRSSQHAWLRSWWFKTMFSWFSVENAKFENLSFENHLQAGV